MTAEAPCEILLRLKPYEYAHITNENTNATELIIGPQTRTLGSDEKLSKPVTAFHVVSPGHYCCIENPFVRAEDGETAVKDNFGQVKVRVGEREMRYGIPAFPLYPEEKLVFIKPLTVLGVNEALLLRAVRDFTSKEGVQHKEEEKYFFKGPGTYYPRVEEEEVEIRRAMTLTENQALHLRAVESFKDENGILRRSHDRYLRTLRGSYICNPHETLIAVVSPIQLKPDEGLHVRVDTQFIDERPHALGVLRRPGELYLVTHEECPLFFLHPYERIKNKVEKLHISKRQFAIVVNTESPGRRFVTDTSFYLKGYEKLKGDGICNNYLLNSGQAILLKAIEDFKDTDVDPPVDRKGGECWLLHGPRDYIPNAYVMICKDKDGKEIRERVVLNDGEGIYVRNIATGLVRAVNGPIAYMLDAMEELWEKKLSRDVEMCLSQQLLSCTANIFPLYENIPDKHNYVGKTHKTVMYQVPHRSVTQVYNYRALTTRIIFGPDRVLLEPDEEFTVITLSGSPWDPQNPNKCLPKEAQRIKALHVFLGPSNMIDIVHVETRDHAQLALQLSYTWYFDVTPGDEEGAKKCFNVTDFVADTCSLIAGRVREAVASLPFQQFHKNNAKILQHAVFGVDPLTGNVKKELRFEANNFVVVSVDTQQVEVLDSRTREGLQKSVKIAIEVSTQAQESNAQQIALAREQQSFGLLEMQKMEDQVANETQRKVLLEAEAKSLAMTTSGRLKSIADAAAQAAAVEQDVNLHVARIRAEKNNVTGDILAEMEQQKRIVQHEYELERENLTYALQSELAKIESDKFTEVVNAIGADTIAEIAKAGPEVQAKLLSSLGLEGYLVTDGSTPLNLFKTAEEMTAKASN
ncbi:major vault protein [Trypanosoma theileri]|uniref:Major vault protein n=1 Tax=Trypanosoma theileri TaxID=67003 RepID=A0A1X0P8P2_9TRYP|nr:major vault protein [Trypanosoma theileri]ORC92993.1 major vault protein [Trypanosoma theileri]